MQEEKRANVGKNDIERQIIFAQKMLVKLTIR